MIMKLGTGMKRYLFYTVAPKQIVTSPLFRNDDVITCSLAEV